MPKKIPKWHKIWEDWISILKMLCSDIWFLFRSISENDYWIDWEIEILKNANEIGHKFQVQVKSSDKFSIKNWKLSIRQISRDDLEYRHNDINLPVFVIAVEINTKKVFWIDTRDYYAKIIKNLKQKTIIIEADQNNQLNLSNKDKFINFTKELDYYNANKVLIRSSPLEKIRIIWKNKWYQVMEEVKWNNNCLTLFHTNNSINNPINWTFFLKDKKWDNEFNIEKFILKIWDELIWEFNTWKIKFTEILEEKEIYLKSKNYEYKVRINTNTKDETFFLNSLEGELFNIKISTNINTKITKFNLIYNFRNLKTIKELYYGFSFFKELEDWFDILILDENWMKKDFVWWKIKISKNDLDAWFYELISLLYQVENKLNIKFSINSFFDSDYSNTIPFLKTILNWSFTAKWDIKLNVTLSEDINIPTTEQYFRNTFDSIVLFWTIIPLKFFIDCHWIIKNLKWKYIIETKELVFHCEK